MLKVRENTAPSPLKLVPETEQSVLLSRARTWGRSHTMFSSAASTATLAAAEHLANLQGLTFYAMLVGEENPLQDIYAHSLRINMGNPTKIHLEEFIRDNEFGPDVAERLRILKCGKSYESGGGGATFRWRVTRDS